MMSAAQSYGAELRAGQIIGMVQSADGSAVKGVEVDGAVLESDAVVIAMGPWSLMAAAWVHLPAVFGQRSPSLVYDTGTDVPADALFLEYHEGSTVAVTVEVFPRADGSTLITAFSDQAPLPLDPAVVTADQKEVTVSRRSPNGCHRSFARTGSSRGKPASGRSRETVCR